MIANYIIVSNFIEYRSSQSQHFLLISPVSTFGSQLPLYINIWPESDHESGLSNSIMVGARTLKKLILILKQSHTCGKAESLVDTAFFPRTTRE